MGALTKEDVKEIIDEAIENKVKDFYINREEHYQHHQFVKSFIELMQTSRKTAMRVIIGSATVAVIGLVVAGFWGRIRAFMGG